MTYGEAPQVLWELVINSLQRYLLKYLLAADEKFQAKNPIKMGYIALQFAHLGAIFSTASVFILQPQERDLREENLDG